MAMALDHRGVDLLPLHRLVVGRTGRVELACGDGSKSVLISKDELEALENALLILSNSTELRELHEDVAKLTSSNLGPNFGGG